MDSVTYAASKSYAKSLATGIASVSLDGMTLNITCADGTIIPVEFTEPEDGETITMNRAKSPLL